MTLMTWLECIECSCVQVNAPCTHTQWTVRLESSPEVGEREREREREGCSCEPPKISALLKFGGVTLGMGMGGRAIGFLHPPSSLNPSLHVYIHQLPLMSMYWYCAE